MSFSKVIPWVVVGLLGVVVIAQHGRITDLGKELGQLQQDVEVLRASVISAEQARSLGASEERGERDETNMGSASELSARRMNDRSAGASGTPNRVGERGTRQDRKQERMTEFRHKKLNYALTKFAEDYEVDADTLEITEEILQEWGAERTEVRALVRDGEMDFEEGQETLEEGFEQMESELADILGESDLEALQQRLPNWGRIQL